MHPLDFRIAHSDCTTQDRPNQSICLQMQGHPDMSQHSGSLSPWIWGVGIEAPHLWLLFRLRLDALYGHVFRFAELLNAVIGVGMSHEEV